MTTKLDASDRRPLYHYAAHVTGVYDADTITVDIDLGFGIVMRDREIRLWGINAPEVKGGSRTEGLRSRDYVRGLLVDQWVIIRTELDRTEKYGRLLGYVFTNQHPGGVIGDWYCLNEVLVESDLALMATYGDTFKGWPSLDQ